MKKILASTLFMLVFAAYALSQYLGNGSASAIASAPAAAHVAATSRETATGAGIASAAPPTPAPSAPAPQPRGQYVNGTYTGTPEDAYYGNVQVAVTVSGGKISDVRFLQYPNDRSTSRYINSQAMPILRSEAIQVQGAQVDGVSGASDTSAAFQLSLAAALSQAKS